MSKSSFVLTGLLLFFVQTVSGKNCSSILNDCKTLLGSVSNSLDTNVLSSNKTQCQTITDLDNECKAYQKFWACWRDTSSSCGKDVNITSELQVFADDHDSKCVQEMCHIEVKKCRCLTDFSFPTSEAIAFQNIPKACSKNLKLLRDCIVNIKDCDHSSYMQKSTRDINFLKSICKQECPSSYICLDGFASSSEGFGSSFETNQTCGVLRRLFQCLSAVTNTCSASLSDKWQRVDRSYEATCSADKKRNNSWCSSLSTCLDKIFLTTATTAQEILNDATILLANHEKVMPTVLNPGWWCSYLTRGVMCMQVEADACSSDAIQKEQTSALKATVDELCKETDARQNCTMLLHSCNPSLKSDKQFGVRTRESIKLVQCQVIESVDTTCTSFEKLGTCVNSTLFTQFCEDDPEISSELSNLQESYTDPCSKDTLCAVELVKCACSADILNFASMCKSMDTYKDCAGKIKECNKDTQMWQSLSITFKMSEGACKTECPGAFVCWMDSQDQVDYLFARLYSAVETLTSQTCRSLVARFQCLSRNTSSCSDSLIHKWQRVVKSYEAVCSVFQQNTTDASSCPSLRTCVYKAQLVPGVSLDDLNTRVTALLHAAEVGSAILDPSTWCRVLIQVIECMEQEDDTCLWTTAIKENFTAANATVRGFCKEQRYCYLLRNNVKLVYPGAIKP